MVIEYLNQQYNLTLWPFFSLVEITNRFGQKGIIELDELFEQGIVRKREGIRGILIELVKE